MRLKLPHIPRFISATILPAVATVSLWTIGIGLVSLNIFMAKARPAVDTKELSAVFARPFSEPVHEALALALWANSLHAAAKQELLVANELIAGQPQENSARILGASTSPLELLQRWEQEPVKEAAALAYWQRVAAARPDYRDAFVQLAAISYAQGNLIQTKSYLTQAAALDPNGQAVNALLAFVSKELER